MKAHHSTTPFVIGSDTMPGLAKFIEEAGEALQVAGKLMATAGSAEHWDGTDLHRRLEEELGDLMAAIQFLVDHNDVIDRDACVARTQAKWAIYEQWHAEAQL